MSSWLIAILAWAAKKTVVPRRFFNANKRLTGRKAFFATILFFRGRDHARIYRELSVVAVRVVERHVDAFQEQDARRPVQRDLFRKPHAVGRRGLLQRDVRTLCDAQ